MSGSDDRTWTLHLGQPERKVLGELLEQLAGVVAPLPAGDDPLERLVGITAADRPMDPAVLRLFPDGYGTPEEAAEFRRYTEGPLRQAKVETIQVMRQSLEFDPVVIDAAVASAWLRTLNDLRLFLGTRLEITANEDEVMERVEADPQTYAVYEFLGWLQQSLLEQIVDA